MLSQFDLMCALSLGGYARGVWGLAKDAAYSTVSVEFIREALSAWLDSLPPKLLQWRDIGGGKTVRFVRWEAESGDCDNIAWDFCAFLSRCMWVDAIKTGKARGNVAAGAFYFQVRPGDVTSGHAIVWFVDHESRVHHVDPGSQQIDHLTAEQLGTIYGGDYA